MRAWIGMIGLLCAFGASAAPKIAVTDLAYEARVEEYIHEVSASNNFQASAYQRQRRVELQRVRKPYQLHRTDRAA